MEVDTDKSDDDLSSPLSDSSSTGYNTVIEVEVESSSCNESAGELEANDIHPPHDGDVDTSFSSASETESTLQKNEPSIPNVRCNALDTDSDSCTDSDAFPARTGRTTDDTTSTSESEDTQIWVPVVPVNGNIQRTSAVLSGASSNASDSSQPRNVGGSGNIMSTPIQGGSMGQCGRDSNSDPSLIRQGRTNSQVSQRSQHAAAKKGLPRPEAGIVPSDRVINEKGPVNTIPNGDSGIGCDGGDTSPLPSDELFLTESSSTTPTSILKRANGDARHDGYSLALLDSLFVTLSGLYGIIVVVLGAVIPISELFTVVPHPFFFQGFYVYLYAVSIAFLVYAYAYLLHKGSWNANIFVRRKQHLDSMQSALTDKQRKRKISYYDPSANYHTGSFYLRLGAVGFGIGSMIKSGLHFGEFFEDIDQEKTFCSNILHGIHPLLHLCFTFIQLYFVFLNSKMCIHRYKIIARFGIMHMVATNLCVWLENIVLETVREIERVSSHEGHPHLSYTLNRSSDNKTEIHPSDTHANKGNQFCNADGLMKGVIEESGPYLYPCSIEYSLICAGVLFVMWRNVGNARDSASHEDAITEAKGKSMRLNVDCSNSSRGLFLGIFVLVAAVITMITFFVLVKISKYNEIAIQIEHLSVIVIHIFASLAVILAFHRMQSLRFDLGSKIDLEEALLILSLTGVYTFGLFSIIAASLSDQQQNSVLIVVSSVLSMFQSTIQSVFILNALRRSAWKRDHERFKPGREFVTFLLVCNIAVWGINTFEVQRSEANPVQLDFFGVLAWNVFTHISIPLAIFFRFHSTVCLSNIWKHAWKRRN